MLCHIVAAGTVAFRLRSRVAACAYLQPAVCRRSAHGPENISYSNRAIQCRGKSEPNTWHRHLQQFLTRGRREAGICDSARLKRSWEEKRHMCFYA